MAELEKRGPGTWRARAYVGRRPDGTKITISRTIKAPHTREGRRIALRAAAELDVEAVERRTPTRVDGLTVDELARRWIRHKTDTWQPRTLRSAEDRVRLHITPTIGHMPIRDVNPATLDHLYAELGDTLAPASIQRVHAAISGMFTTATRWGLVDTNPAGHAEPPKPKRTRTITIPTDEQRRNAWDIDADPFWQTLLRVAIGTGARREELAGLRWSAVDEDVVTIDIAITHTRQQIHVGPTKSGRTRTFHMGDDVTNTLDKWRKDRLDTLGGLPEYVWHNRRHDGPCHPDSITGWWRRNRGSVDCPRVRFHDWRHWNATHLLSLGVPAQTVAHRLGHTVSVLESTYSHYLNEADRDAAAALRL